MGFSVLDLGFSVWGLLCGPIAPKLHFWEPRGWGGGAALGAGLASQKCNFCLRKITLLARQWVPLSPHRNRSLAHTIGLGFNIIGLRFNIIGLGFNIIGLGFRVRV